MLSCVASIHSEVKSISEYIPGSNYSSLMCLSMLSCVASIHSEVNSVAEWTPVINDSFLI